VSFALRLSPLTFHRTDTSLLVPSSGFSYASFARRFLIEDPKIVFPLVSLALAVVRAQADEILTRRDLSFSLFSQTLQQVAVFKSMRDSFEYNSATNKKQMRVFWYGILAFFVWQFVSTPLLASISLLEPFTTLTFLVVAFLHVDTYCQLPEYVAPLLSSLTILCWVSSNPNVTFAGSGLGGAGFLNITLDWSNIGSSVIYQVSSCYVRIQLRKSKGGRHPRTNERTRTLIFHLFCSPFLALVGANQRLRRFRSRSLDPYSCWMVHRSIQLGSLPE